MRHLFFVLIVLSISIGFGANTAFAQSAPLSVEVTSAVESGGGVTVGGTIQSGLQFCNLNGGGVNTCDENPNQCVCPCCNPSNFINPPSQDTGSRTCALGSTLSYTIKNSSNVTVASGNETLSPSSAPAGCKNQNFCADFQNGEDSCQQTDNFSFSESGLAPDTYTVTVTASDCIGSKSASRTFTIAGQCSFGSQLAVNGQTGTVNVTAGNSVTMTTSVTNQSNCSADWRHRVDHEDDGTYDQTQDSSQSSYSFTHTYATPGTYTAGGRVVHMPSGATQNTNDVTVVVGSGSNLLTLNKAGNGEGTVTSNPAGIDCGTSCASDSATLGGNVVLSASWDSADNLFDGWTGGVGGSCNNANTSPTCTVSMTQAQTVMATFNSLENAITGRCNENNTGQYACSASGFVEPGDFCDSGTPSPTNPVFPAAGGSVTWQCLGSGGGFNATCNANRLNTGCGNTGTCGSNNGQTYANSVTAWPNSSASAFCSNGTVNPSSPSFPAAGSQTSWTCVGAGGTSPTCSATRQPASGTNGQCGTRATNYNWWTSSYPSGTFCAQGTASPASPVFPAQGGSTNWTCQGSGGGTNVSCTATRGAYSSPPPVLEFSVKDDASASYAVTNPPSDGNVKAIIDPATNEALIDIDWYGPGVSFSPPVSVNYCMGDATPANSDWTMPVHYSWTTNAWWKTGPTEKTDVSNTQDTVYRMVCNNSSGDTERTIQVHQAGPIQVRGWAGSVGAGNELPITWQLSGVENYEQSKSHQNVTVPAARIGSYTISNLPDLDGYGNPTVYNGSGGVASTQTLTNTSAPLIFDVVYPEESCSFTTELSVNGQTSGTVNVGVDESVTVTTTATNITGPCDLDDWLHRVDMDYENFATWPTSHELISHLTPEEQYTWSYTYSAADNHQVRALINNGFYGAAPNVWSLSSIIDVNVGNFSGTISADPNPCTIPAIPGGGWQTGCSTELTWSTTDVGQHLIQAVNNAPGGETEVVATEEDDVTNETLTTAANITEYGIEYQLWRKDSNDNPVGNVIDSVTVLGERQPECSDGVDNADTEDGLADANDPGCWAIAGDSGSYNPNDNDERDGGDPQCSDGFDNDGDGRIDWNGGSGGEPADPGCNSDPDDDDEIDTAVYECSDGFDNDGDGYTDFSGGDPECESGQDDNEARLPDFQEF